MAYDLIGKNFTPPDVRAKVTGKSTYSEDIRAEGMAFCKLLTSPYPHAKVTNIDASEALKMEGVYGVLLPSDVPNFPPPQESILTMEPTFVGDPILAVAAVDELTAENAIEKIKVEYQALPFVIDPLQSLQPGGVDAHEKGNVVTSGSGEGIGGTPQLKDVKWTAKDFAMAKEGQLPEGQPMAQWEFGDVDGGFKKAKLVLDESFVTASNPHHSMEPRSAFAYWENGKCTLYGSTQSQSFVMTGLANLLGVSVDKINYISEYCGGGFGSKGSAYAVMTVPAHMAKKINKPCLLRITRAEEYYLGSARAGFQGRIKLGFAADGRLLAADLYVVQQNGSKQGFFDYSAAGDAISLVYQPEAMRFRAIPVSTNTPPCGPQRGPGQNQMAVAMEPLMDKAAKSLGVDRLKIREINAPDISSKVDGRQKVSSAYVHEALEMTAKRFNYADKIKMSGQKNGSKVIGVGVGQAYHSAGGSGFDGLVRITADGKLHIHSGVGNLGTYSYATTSRVAAEVLGCSWDDVIIEHGDSRKALPWNLGQFGSNTSFTMSRTNYAAAMDCKQKLQEIASMGLGGKPEDYDVGGQMVFLKSDKSKNISFADAAKKAIELGGKYDGHEPPGDVFFITKASVAQLAGTGLIGVAKDTLALKDHVATFTVGMMMIELDTETGKFEIKDYAATADCGTVVYPMGLHHQIRGGGVMGIGFATLEHAVYDPQNGLAANVGLYQCKPPSYLDVPSEMDVAGVDKPDPDSPLGMKGVGEPPLGAAASALLSAISDALGGHYFNRTPVKPDMIVNAAAGRPQSHTPLQVNCQ